MSSTESSGAPAEATATPPASNAAFPTFGSTRGSGLARGKRPSTGPAPTTAASAEYTPTAIEVVSAPREYQNPFAPVETPAAVTIQPVAAPAVAASVTPIIESPAPARAEFVESVAVETPAPVHAEAAAPESDEPAELNILEPEQQKTAPAQTWESDGFRPAREPRNDRPRREESRREERTERAPRQESAPFDPASIPAKFLYVRPGYNYVPTPSNYGGAPRDRESSPAASSPAYSAYSAPVAAAPQKSGGFLGWLKSLFGGAPAAPAPVEAQQGEPRHGGRHRGGRGRGGEGQGEHRGGGQRRHRGGRGRNQSRGEYRSGGDQAGNSGGPPAS